MPRSRCLKAASMNKTALSDYSIADPKIQECPYHYYRLMQSNEPVYYDAKTDLWMVASYDLAVEVLSNWDVFSSNIDMRTEVDQTSGDESLALLKSKGYLVKDVLSQVDPPDHTFYRKLVDRAFTGPVVRRMESYLEEHTEALVRSFIHKGECDFYEEFAVPLPLGVIADQLGVPQKDMGKFKVWTDAIIETLGVVLSPERKLACAELIIGFQHYFVGRFEEKKSKPEDDLLSGLVSARHADGSELSIEELLALTQQLLVAGNETTRNHLAKSVLLLIENPEYQDLLRSDPSLVPKFVEETLRIESPVQGLFRKTTRETRLGKRVLPKGAKLYVAYGAANRDSKMFPEAEKIDLERANTNRHLAFSHGIHRCIGQMLARKELEIAIKSLTRQMKNIRHASREPTIEHVPSFILRGLKQLHIKFDQVT